MRGKQLWLYVLTALFTVAMSSPARAQERAPATRPTTRPTTRQAMAAIGVMGTVLKVDGKNLVVKPIRGIGDGSEVVLPTDDQTIFFVDYERGKLDEIKPDMTVRVTTLRSLRNRPARSTVTASSQPLAGVVVQVDGDRLTLFGRVDRTWSDSEVVMDQNPGEGRFSIRFLRTQPPEAPKQWIVTTDENTRVLFLGTGREPGKVGTLKDLEPEMRVHVIPAEGTARKIVVNPGMGGVLVPRPGLDRN